MIPRSGVSTFLKDCDKHDAWWVYPSHSRGYRIVITITHSDIVVLVHYTDSVLLLMLLTILFLLLLLNLLQGCLHTHTHDSLSQMSSHGIFLYFLRDYCIY